MDNGSIASEELEYEFLRTLCDLAIAYRRLAESSGLEVPTIGCTVGFLEEQMEERFSDFGDLEIVL